MKNEINCLLEIDDNELEEIYTNISKNNSDIQLLDYIDKIGLTDNQKDILKQNIKNQIPKERYNYYDKYKKVINSSRTMDHNLSNLRLNPCTEFEEEPYLFFGIGGGSKALCKGLPFDVLTMILTGEKIRRNLNIKKCRILLANRITYTNIERNSEFSKESIDNVLKVEKEIILLTLKKFGFDKNWDVFLQTDIEEIIGKNETEKYEQIIEIADSSKLVGGHHYAIEMADIYAMVGNNSGGIKLGWFIRNLDTKNGGYIMDEQPFHARYILLMAKLGIKNKVTFAYANAGARLYPGITGHMEKESPYICYDPNNRLLLSPFEDPVCKLGKATLAGGAFEYKYYRKFINGIADLFEELVLTKPSDKIISRIKTSHKNEFRGMDIAEKAAFILKYIYNGEEHYKEIWNSAFKWEMP